MELTKLLHALLVRLIQEEVALLDRAMHVEAQAQTGVVHQLRVNVMDQSLRSKHTITQTLTGSTGSFSLFLKPIVMLQAH